jgi:hypothetical protein
MSTVDKLIAIFLKYCFSHLFFTRGFDMRGGDLIGFNNYFNRRSAMEQQPGPGAPTDLISSGKSLSIEPV